MWDQWDSYPVCLRCSYPWWSPSSLISPFLSPRHPRPPFFLCLPWPSICFPINHHLLISASFTLYVFSQPPPDVLFKCICPIPSYFISFSLLLYQFVSFPWTLFHSTVSAFSLSGLSRGVLTGAIMGCCQRSPPLSVSTSVSSASLMVECQKETKFLCGHLGCYSFAVHFNLNYFSISHWNICSSCLNLNSRCF